jgi:two-component system response regulator ChvI
MALLSGVRAFARGADALEVVAWSTVELVISDRTNFPMNGVEFVGRVRERSNVPVVFVSAWAAELEEELRGTEFAADDYIAVPFSLKNVVARVESVLELRRAGAP